MGTHIDNAGRMTVSNSRDVVDGEWRQFALTVGGHLPGLSRQDDSDFITFNRGPDTEVAVQIVGSNSAFHLDVFFSAEEKAQTWRWSGTGPLWHLRYADEGSLSTNDLVEKLGRLFG